MALIQILPLRVLRRRLSPPVMYRPETEMVCAVVMDRECEARRREIWFHGDGRIL